MTWKLMKYLWTRLVMTINSVICSSCAAQHYGTHIKRSNHQPFWLVTHSHSWFSIKCLWLNQRNLHPLTSKSMCMAEIRKSSRFGRWRTDKKLNYCLSTWKNGDILSNATYMISLTDCQQSIKTQSCCLRISNWKKKWLAKRYRQFSEVVSFARSQVTIKQSYVGDFGTTKEWATSRGRSVIYYKTEIQIGIYRRKDCIFFHSFVHSIHSVWM